MSDFPDDWPDVAWNKLPVELRKRAVARLQWIYPPSFFEDVRRLIQKNQKEASARDRHFWYPALWHFDQGMEVRNMLRSDHLANLWGPGEWSEGELPPPIPDSALPPLPEIYDGMEQGNWDDYYVQVVEAAAGMRDIDASSS